jgi:dTDP-4-dehydrorhamnose reductase
VARKDIVKILITGASGQLGRCLQIALTRHEVVALDRRALDISQLAQVRHAIAGYRPALVINAAAFNDVDGANSRSTEAYAVNALGPRNLAVATAATEIALLHVSTDFVFDGAAARPYHEFDRPNPLSSYGASKLAGEKAVQLLNVRHYIVRTAWLFWENGANFLRSMHARSSDSELRVVSDQSGSPTYVPHLAAAIARLIATDAYGTFHLAGSGVVSRWELVCELFRVAGIATPVVPVSHREFSVAAKRPSYSALTSIQDPRIELPPWQEGVAEYAFNAASRDRLKTP